MIASATQRIRGLLRSIPPDLRFTDLRWSRESLQHFIGDEALIDAAQRIHGSLQNALRVRNDLRKFLQRTSTQEYLPYCGPPPRCEVRARLWYKSSASTCPFWAEPPIRQVTRGQTPINLLTTYVLAKFMHPVVLNLFSDTLNECLEFPDVICCMG